MTDDERAAIAAETFLLLERSSPGGTMTTAWRIRYPRLKAVAAKMAGALDANASPADRRAWLNALDDQGSDDLKPINMTTNLKTMTADERLDHANKLAGDGKRK